MSVPPSNTPCERTRERLLTASIDELSDMRATDPHLAGDTPCLQCRALVDALLERHTDLDRGLDAFASRPLPQPEASSAPSPRPRSWTMSATQLTLAAAALATLTLVGVQQASMPDGLDGGGASATCTMDEAMETRALTGRLADDEVACLEASGGEKANRMLMVHWFSAGKREAWRERAQIELNRQIASKDIDTDVVYKVALADSQTGDHASAWDLAALGLEHLDQWPDDVAAKRRVKLLKIRAAAAMKQWGDSDSRSDKATVARAVAAYEAAKAELEEQD